MASVIPDSGAAGERRRQPRKNIIQSQLLTAEITLAVAGNGQQRQHGIVIDLSEGGMAVQPFLSLAPGAVGQVQLDLPGSEKPFESQGMVAWVGPGGRAGIRFLDPSPGSHLQLHQ